MRVREPDAGTGARARARRRRSSSRKAANCARALEAEREGGTRRAPARMGGTSTALRTRARELGPAPTAARWCARALVSWLGVEKVRTEAFLRLSEGGGWCAGTVHLHSLSPAYPVCHSARGHPRWTLPMVVTASPGAPEAFDDNFSFLLS